MNAERLHLVARTVQEELNKSNLVGRLQTLTTTLQNIVNQPQAAPHQQALGTQLKEIRDVLATSSSNEFPPTWKDILSHIGEGVLLGEGLQERVDDIFSRNQITHAIALAEIRDLSQKMQTFKAGIDQLAQAFSNLKIGVEDLVPGECEIGVLIPRKAVNNRLGDLARELKDVGFILGHFSEIVTGKKEDFEIRTLSSSELLIFLKAPLAVAACIAHCVAKVVEFYKTLLEIRRLQAGLRTQQVPEESLRDIDEYANSVMEKKLEELQTSTMGELGSQIPDGRRRNELKIALLKSLRMLANRIDKGYNIEVRVTPLTQEAVEADTSATQKNDIAKIQQAAKTLQYINLEGAPILKLEEGKSKSDD